MQDDNSWKSQSMEPKITDMMVVDGSDHGRVIGGTSGRKGSTVNVGGKNGEGEITTRIEAGSDDLNMEDGLIFIENKRRRTQDDE